MLHAKDLMQKNVPITYDDCPLAEAYYYMLKCRTRHLPVMNREKHLVGILSRGDILLHSSCDYEGESVHTAKVTVGHVMSKQIISCDGHTSLADVAATMIACKIDCIPVLEKGALAGLIQTTDFLTMFYLGQLECAS